MKMNKKTVYCVLAAVALFATVGCQTRITAEKNAEVANPIYGTVNDHGTNAVRVVGYAVTSGGWYATARSPLWATEELRGLNIGVQTNGAVTLGLDAYHRDLSTNAVTMAHNLVVDFAELAEKAVVAYGTAGASLATAKAQSALKKGLATYLMKGGKSGDASVTCADGSCTVTDGSITETFQY